MRTFFFLSAMIPMALFGRVVLPGGTATPLFGEFSETVFFDDDAVISRAYLQFAVRPQGEWPVMVPWTLGPGVLAGKLEVGRDVNEDGELSLEEVAMAFDLVSGALTVDARSGLVGAYAPVLMRDKRGMSVKIIKGAAFWLNPARDDTLSEDFIINHWNCFRLTLNGRLPGSVRAFGGWWGDGLRVIVY